MAASSADEDAALARVETANAEHDAAAITRELEALLGSERVVLRCCEALQNDETARAAAASPGVLLLLLKALRRHASFAVVAAAWRAMHMLLLHGGDSEAVVEHGALELALASIHDTIESADAVRASLAVFSRLVFPKHVAHAMQLGGVEVRFHL